MRLFHDSHTCFSQWIKISVFIVPAILSVTACREKAPALKQTGAIDFLLTERLSRPGDVTESGCEAVEVYSSGLQRERQQFFLSIEELRARGALIGQVRDGNSAGRAVTLLRKSMASLSSATLFPKLSQAGTTYHLLFSFDQGTRFAYFEIFVPSDHVSGQETSVVVPRSDSPSFPGEALMDWISTLTKSALQDPAKR